MDLTRFARVRLTHAPTPLEHLPRLSKLLGGPEIYLKRDDCTGLASGGNKTRNSNSWSAMRWPKARPIS